MIGFKRVGRKWYVTTTYSNKCRSVTRVPSWKKMGLPEIAGPFRSMKEAMETVASSAERRAEALGFKGFVSEFWRSPRMYERWRYPRADDDDVGFDDER